ncbi:MAG: TauD/TfdA family dioxygenase [Coxiellaceae bacterium]|nr:TauD/TfdA family dioxygenase [Coxiellaceae bacterium]
MPLSLVDTFKKTPLVKTLQLNSSLSLVDFVNLHRDQINSCIDSSGGILIRGCPLQAEQEFQTITESLFGPCLEYIGGVSPRQKRKQQVYNSTYLASDMIIPQHREMSYLPEYPDRINFYCQIPAQSGGETPVTDFATVYTDLLQKQPELMQRLNNTGVLINKVYYDSDFLKKHLGIESYWGWRECFQCTSHTELDKVGKQLGVEFQHHPGYSAMIVTVPIATAHPLHNNPVFFPNLYLNKRTLYKYFELSESNQLFLTKLDTFVQTQDGDIYTGDGSLIPEYFIHDFHKSVVKNTHAFDWQAHDLLLLDNNWLGHGRTKFIGENRTLWACMNNVVT